MYIHTVYIYSMDIILYVILYIIFIIRILLTETD